MIVIVAVAIQYYRQASLNGHLYMTNTVIVPAFYLQVIVSAVYY